MTPRYRRWVKSIDKKIDPESIEAQTAAMLLCSAKQVSRGHKVDVKKILAATGVPSNPGLGIAENLRKNRIWWFGKLRHSGWGDKETGEIAFCMDVLCGAGLMKRATPTSGEVKP